MGPDGNRTGGQNAAYPAGLPATGAPHPRRRARPQRPAEGTVSDGPCLIGPGADPDVVLADGGEVGAREEAPGHESA